MPKLEDASRAEKDAVIKEVEGFAFSITFVGAELSAVYASLLTMRSMAVRAGRTKEPEFPILERALHKVEFIVRMGAQPPAGSA